VISTGGSFTALFDANALFSPLVVDLALSLATADVFRPKWSIQIHEEWVHAVLRRKPQLSEERLRRRSVAMNEAFPDAMVLLSDGQVKAFTNLLPDPKDGHVLAAAVVGRANVVVTDNAKDFPKSVIAQFELESQSTDHFLSFALDIDSAATKYALKAMVDRRKQPQPWSIGMLPLEFEQRGLLKTAARIRAIISDVQSS
jgi:predicted nucleic acid-binding protein